MPVPFVPDYLPRGNDVPVRPADGQVLGLWVAVSGTAHASVRSIPDGRSARDGQPEGRIVVVDLSGRLDSAAVQPCRAALDTAIGLSDHVVVDLTRVRSPVADGVALLGAIHRYVRARRATLTLAGLAGPLRSALRLAGVLDQYDLCGRYGPTGPGRVGPPLL